MKKIVRISRLLKWSAAAICIALPFIEAGYWITEGYPFLKDYFPFSPLPQFGTYIVTWGDLTALQRFLAFLVSSYSTVAWIIPLVCLTKIFAAFEKKDLFSKKHVDLLWLAGMALVIGQLIYPLHIGFLSLVLTMKNPVGERILSLTFGPHQLEILLIGLSIMLASWVFKEAVDMREEQEGTI